MTEKIDFMFTADVSDEEELAVGRRVLGIVQSAFGELPSEKDEAQQTHIARRVVKALAVAHKALHDETKRLRSEKGGSVYLNLGAPNIVATVFWFWIQEIEVSPEETFPSTVVGSNLLGFFQGVLAAKLSSEAAFIMEDENDDEGIYTSGADRLLGWADSDQGKEG